MKEYVSPEELNRGRSERFSSEKAILNIDLLQHGRNRVLDW